MVEPDKKEDEDEEEGEERESDLNAVAMLKPMHTAMVETAGLSEEVRDKTQEGMNEMKKKVDKGKFGI